MCLNITDYFKCTTFCTTVQSCKAAASNSCFDSCLCEVQIQTAEIPLVVGWEHVWVCCWCEFQQCRLTDWWELLSPTVLPFWSQVWASQVGAAAPQHSSVLSAAPYEWDTTPFLFLQIHQIPHVSFPSFTSTSSCSFSFLFLLFKSSQAEPALKGKTSADLLSWVAVLESPWAHNYSLNTHMEANYHQYLPFLTFWCTPLLRI